MTYLVVGLHTPGHFQIRPPSWLHQGGWTARKRSLCAWRFPTQCHSGGKCCPHPLCSERMCWGFQQRPLSLWRQSRWSWWCCWPGPGLEGWASHGQAGQGRDPDPFASSYVQRYCSESCLWKPFLISSRKIRCFFTRGHFGQNCHKQKQ